MPHWARDSLMVVSLWAAKGVAAKKCKRKDPPGAGRFNPPSRVVRHACNVLSTLHLGHQSKGCPQGRSTLLVAFLVDVYDLYQM